MDKAEYLRRMGIETWRLRPTNDTENSAEDPVESQPKIEFPPPPAESVTPSVPTQSAVQTVRSQFADFDMSTLRSVALTCEKCSLSESRKNVVFGTGSEQAEVMVIGEAPGADEDAQGLPFVGKAGKLLTSILRALGYSREDVYIANVLKCRPPSNRDPLPTEARSCSPYLQRQIQLISPKVIIAVGRVSAQLLLDTELSLRQLRAQRHTYRDTGIEVVVTYHPAYLLRRLTEKSKVWEDLLRVREILG